MFPLNVNCLSICFDKINCRSIFTPSCDGYRLEGNHQQRNAHHDEQANLSRRISNVIVALHAASFICFGIEVLTSYTDDYDDDEIEMPVHTEATSVAVQRIAAVRAYYRSGVLSLIGSFHYDRHT